MKILVTGAAGFIAPASMSRCTNDWSLVTCVATLPRTRYPRLSPTWHRYSVSPTASGVA